MNYILVAMGSGFIGFMLGVVGAYELYQYYPRDE